MRRQQNLSASAVKDERGLYAGGGAAAVPGAGGDHAGEDPGGGVRARGAGGEAAAEAAVRRAGRGIRERPPGAGAAARGNCDTDAPRSSLLRLTSKCCHYVETVADMME